MNNISQKNAIFRFKESNLLPYGKSDIKFVNNQSINQINVNNALQQLRDNDLYIENQLNYLSGYEPGPIAYSSDISSTFVDGQKYWIGTDPTQQLSILQKKNKIPQNTLSKNGKISGDVKYIVKYSGLYFCGATNNSNGKIYYSTDSKTWNELSGGDSYTYHKGDDKLLVGCGENILFVEVSGSSPSAYQVNASGAFGSSPTAINVDDENRIYVGTKNNKIFTSKYDQLSDLTQSNLRFTELSVDNTLGGWANDIVFREKIDTFTDENYIMASFKNGVAESFYQKHLSGEQRLFTGSSLCDMVFFKNKIYVGGTAGLSTINPVSMVTGNPIYALDKCGDKLYYLTKDNTGIKVYQLPDNELVVNTNSFFDATDLVVVQSDNDNSLLYFIATTRGIYYRYSKEQTIKRLNTLNTSELAANKIGNDLYLYASQVKTNNTKCFLVYKVTGHNNNLIVESDSTEIQSLKKKYSAINNIHSGLLRYKTGFVYVDNNKLCDQGEKLVCQFNNTIKFVKRVSGGTIGASGFIVILNNKIYFVDERNPSPEKEISLSGFSASFSASNITDIVNSDRYVYVITSTKIYICEWTFNNDTKKYTLTKQSDVGGSSLSSGFWINNNLYVLRENNLSAFNTNTQAIQTKNIELSCKVNGDNRIISQFQVLDGVNDSDRIYLANGSNLSVLSGNILSVTHTISADTEIRSIKYNNDTNTIAVRDTQSLSIFNMPDSSDLSVAYVINNLAGVTTDNFIDGKYVITDSSGLRVLEDKIISKEFNYKPTNLKDWQFYDLGKDEDKPLRQFTYATGSDVKLHQIWEAETSLTGNSNTATLVTATANALTHVKLVNSDYVYVSYVSSFTPTGATQPQTVSATFAYGVYGSQKPVGFEEEKLKIASKYFQDITPCQSDHCIFKDNVGIYIDDYTGYSGVVTDGDNNTYKKATQARLKQIYKFVNGEATNFQNVDIISKSDEAEVVLINLKTKIVLVTFYRRDAVTETVNGTPTPVDLVPTTIASIEAAKTISLKYQSSSGDPSNANALKVFFRLCSDDAFECTVLLKMEDNIYNVYNVRFSKSDTQIILTDTHKVVDSVVGLISDTRYNQPCYIKQNGSKYQYYHLQSGQLIKTFNNSNVEIRNMGNQDGFGFAYVSGNENKVVQIKKTNTSKQFNTYNTKQRNCKKIETYAGYYSGGTNPGYKNYVYFLGNDNKLSGAEYLTIESFRNIRPSQLSVENDTSTEPLNGVWDFTINNDNLYYVLTEDPKKLHCRTRILTTDYVFGPEIKDTLPYNISSIALLKDDIAQSLNLELPVALKTGNNQFIGVEQSIPTLTANGGFLSVSKFTESDSGKFYLFNSQDGQISSLSANLSTVNRVNGATDIIPYGSGFGFLSGGTYFTWNENTETSTKVIKKTEEIGDIYGFATYQNCLYSMKDYGLYEPVFKKIYTLPRSCILDKDRNVQQISPIPNTANANLVVKQADNKETYQTYNGNANNITSSKINGIKATDINRALIFYGDNNKRFVKKNGTEFYYSSDGRNFQRWVMTTSEYNNTLYRGYYFNNKFYIIDSEGLWSFDGYSDKTRAFKKIFEPDSSSANFGRFFELGENKYLLESDNGAFYVNGNQFIQLTDADKSVRGIKYVDFGNGIPQYYYSISNAVYATPSFKKITDKISAFVTISANNITPAINDMFAQSPYDFLFATTSGLYQTTYRFTTSNNLTFYNESRVNYIYKKMVSSEISTILSNRIESHKNAWHTSNSIISAINGRILDVDFTRVPETWMSKTSNNNSIVISNDIVSDITFGDQDNNIISVYTSNFVKTDRPNFNYIIKRYKSGMTELYILLDTTNTYYISHVPGSGHTTTINQSFSRKNLEIFGEDVANLKLSSDNDITKFTTSISVVLPQSTLSVNKLLDFEINGCSLPLKIYPDIDGDSFASPKEISGMYQSLIVPSQIKLQSDNLYQTSNGRTCFIGECFGTDQQSIKLHFYDSNYNP